MTQGTTTATGSTALRNQDRARLVRDTKAKNEAARAAYLADKAGVIG